MEGSDFFVEDLLDLSNGGDEMMTDTFIDSFTGHSTDSSSLTPVSDTCNSSVSPSFPEAYFSGTDICVPVCVSSSPLFVFNIVISSLNHNNLCSNFLPPF